MNPILVIDNHRDSKCFGAVEICRSVVDASVGRPLEIQVRRAPERDLPRSPIDFSAIIVSGSSTSEFDASEWIDDLLAWIRQSIDLKIPYLGICFGHQMLVRALCGTQALQKSDPDEFGWVELQTLVQNPLITGLSNSFFSFASHGEEVAALDSRFEVFLRSSTTAIQGIQLLGQSAWGIQFHPEKTLLEANTALAERKHKSKSKKLLRPTEGSRLYQAQVGQTIFKNFLANIQ